MVKQRPNLNIGNNLIIVTTGNTNILGFNLNKRSKSKKEGTVIRYGILNIYDVSKEEHIHSSEIIEEKNQIRVLGETVL